MSGGSIPVDPFGRAVECHNRECFDNSETDNSFGKKYNIMLREKNI